MTTIFAEQVLTPDGWLSNAVLTVADGRITDLRADTSPEEADERHAVLLPAASNLHSHAFQRAMAGLPERRGPQADSFWTWREEMYRFGLTMNPEHVEAVAALTYVEMLENGFSRVGEFHYQHHQPDGSHYDDIGELAARICAAAEATGIGMTLIPVFYAHSNFGGLPPTEGQRRFINDLDGFARLLESARASAARLPRSHVGVAPHSLRAATQEEVEVVAALVEDGPIHIHIAEQVKEVEDCLAWSGARPVEWLLSNVAVDDRWCFIHATHMTEAETMAMAEAGAVAGLCPITEANLGDGIFPGPVFAEAGGRYGVGSDSNVLIGLRDELRQFEYAQRLGNRARNVMAKSGGSTGRALLEDAVAGGAAAMGEGEAGIAAGRSADFFSLDIDHPTFQGRDGDRLIDAWIFANAGGIDCVWSGGAKLVEGGRHRFRDEAERRYRRAMDELLR